VTHQVEDVREFLKAHRESVVKRLPHRPVSKLKKEFGVS